MTTPHDPLAGLPDHDPGELPANFVDPIRNAALPAITELGPDDLDLLPVLPADRLAEEPVDVEVELVLDAHGEMLRMLAPTAIAGINLRDYSKTPQGRGAGAPCSVQLAKVTLSAASFAMDVRLAELTWLIMAANEAEGYLYRKADTGSYNCRKIGKTTSWSWHAWAWAVDANWQTNPYVSPLRTDRPAWERARWNRYGFAGGWDYSGAKDAMHSEYMGTVAQIAASLELARRELLPIINRAGGAVGSPGALPAPSPAPAANGWTEIPMGAATGEKTRGEQVRIDQVNLADTGFAVGAAGADGFAGDDTVAAIRAFQFAAGLKVDGWCGEDTRAALRKVPSYPGGKAYRAFQQRLRDRGWTQVSRGKRVPLIVDGDWGSGSTTALRSFQTEKGLTADGIPGPQSWTALWLRTL